MTKDGCVRLSVVIPVYNVADHLSDCLTSVFESIRNCRMTRHDFTAEVICVDDGSTDDSLERLEETATVLHTAESSVEIRILRQSNRGVSVARNAGLDVARGEWVAFVDGDDRWAPDICRQVFGVIASTPAVDAVVFNMKVIRSGVTSDVDRVADSVGRIEMTGNELLERGRGECSRYIWSVCDKFFRRQTVESASLRFPVGMRLMEDSLFTHIFLAQCGQVAVCPNLVGYYYLMRDSSAVHSTSDGFALSQDPFRFELELYAAWMRIGGVGLLSCLRHAFSRVPFWGGDKDMPMRRACVERLLDDDAFNGIILKFLKEHGSTKQRVFARAYRILPRSLRRRLLLFMAPGGARKDSPFASRGLALVYASSDTNLMPVFVSVCSALAMTGDKSWIEIHILDCGIAEKGWEWLVGHLEERFGRVAMFRHRVDIGPFASCLAHGGALATYAHILTTNIVGENLDWCAFVDSDVLFLDDPLKLLAFCDDDKLILVRHCDHLGNEPSHDWERGLQRKCAENSVKLYPDQHVCIGPVLMNLKRMRIEGFVEKSLNLLLRSKTSENVDHRVFNQGAHERLGRLPEEWGKSDLMLFSDHQVPSCVHYVFSKPWCGKPGWLQCLSDAERFWLQAATELAGLSFATCSQVRRIVFVWRWISSLVMKLLLSLLVHGCRNSPAWAVRRGLFASRSVRCVLMERLVLAKRRVEIYRTRRSREAVGAAEEGK